ncbi:MAG: tRNA (adenosine(37)-N6)-threonylcarbamoyltransferase complex ATPase subunit type 1 TsaE [Acidimicrobiales bacterium]
MSARRREGDAAGTAAAGERFASVLRAGDVVLLTGRLGAGKTTFVQGVARGLGVTDRVTSPTFTMVHEHRCHNARGIETLQHADLYRVGGLAEALDLAIGELVEESAVALVEWGEVAAPAFGPRVMTVEVVVDDDDARSITVAGELSEDRGAELGRWAS